MNEVTVNLATILPVVAIIFTITSLLYSKYRSKFSISVNCWFCDKWTRVSYEYQNSWMCPNCEQYNGFNKNGDYNKVIDEQYQDNISKKPKKIINSDENKSNGLCRTCNDNQLLKIQYLADYVPINENKYDAEIEYYREWLEKIYKLCSKCELSLKKTLSKQNRWLLNMKLSFLRSNSTALIAESLQKSGKSHTFVKCLLALVSIVQIVIVLTDKSNLILFGNLSCYIDYQDLSIFYKHCLNSLHNLFDIDYVYEYYEHFIESYSHFDNKYVTLFVGTFQTCTWFSLLGVFGVMLIFLHVNLTKQNVLSSLLSSVIWVFGIYLSYFEIYRVHLQITSILIYLTTQYSLWSFKRAENINHNAIVKNLSYSPNVISEEEEETINKSSSFNSLFQSHNNESTLYKSLNSLPQHKFGTNPFLIKDNINLEKKYDFKNYRLIKNETLFQKTNYSPDLSNNLFNKKTLTGNNPCINIEPYVDSINKLNIGTKSSENKKTPIFSFQKYNNSNYLGIFPSKSRPFTKSILSPPRLKTVTQASWVAGGYWKSPENSVPLSQQSCLSRSSSQSSGFGSQSSETTTLLPPMSSSRDSSIDRLSVVSEPLNHNAEKVQLVNPVYPTLRYDRHTYIHPHCHSYTVCKPWYITSDSVTSSDCNIRLRDYNNVFPTTYPQIPCMSSKADHIYTNSNPLVSLGDNSFLKSSINKFQSKPSINAFNFTTLSDNLNSSLKEFNT